MLQPFSRNLADKETNK